MLDDILEIVFDFIVEGAIQAVDCKRVPMFVRVLSAAVIMVLLFGVCGFLIGIGISEGENILIVLGVGLFVVFAVLAIYKVIQHKKGGNYIPCRKINLPMQREHLNVLTKQPERSFTMVKSG